MIKKQNKTENSKHSLKLPWWLMTIILILLVISQKNFIKTKGSQSFGSDTWCVYMRSFPLTKIPAKPGTISTLFPSFAGLKPHSICILNYLVFSCSLQGTATVLIGHSNHLQFCKWQVARNSDQSDWLFAVLPTLICFPKESVVLVRIFLFCHSSWATGTI